MQLLAVPIVTVALAVVPVQSPLQLAKVESVAGVAVKVTVPLRARLAWQVVPQLMVALEVVMTIPVPVPVLVIVKGTVEQIARPLIL